MHGDFWVGHGRASVKLESFDQTLASAAIKELRRFVKTPTGEECGVSLKD
jgi:hypothetical protein